MLHNTGFGLGFFNVTLETRNKRKSRQTGLPQNEKLLCFKAYIIKEVKRQPTEHEKISAGHLSDKRLVSRTYEELLQLSNNNRKKKQNQSKLM